MTTNNELAEQIERLVRDHIVAIRTAATAAVQRAFAATRLTAGDPPQRTGRTHLVLEPVAFLRRLVCLPRRCDPEIDATRVGRDFRVALDGAAAFDCIGQVTPPAAAAFNVTTSAHRRCRAPAVRGDVLDLRARGETWVHIEIRSLT